MNMKTFWKIVGGIAILGAIVVIASTTTTRAMEIKESCIIGLVQTVTQPDSGGPIFLEIVAAPQEVKKSDQMVMYPMTVMCSYFDYPDTLYVQPTKKEEEPNV
jgi:hypothetical protein